MAISKYILIFFQKGKQGFITRNQVLDLQLQLDKFIKTKPKETEIDVWLESPGGDAHSAYKMWLELRARANKVRAWIPDYAKSAATLLALGMDELYMAVGAEIGPLDMQIAHPDRENITVSALDVANSLDYFSKFSIELAIGGGAALLEYTSLTRVDILKEMLPFAAKLIEPCINKIDPHLTHKAIYQLKVAEHYARRMLRNRNLPQGQQLSNEAAGELIERLVHRYPVHECVIGRDEAKQLGLPVYNIEERPEWEIIKKEYWQFVQKESAKDEETYLLVVPFETLNNTAKKTKTTKKRKTKKKRKKAAKKTGGNR